MLRATVRLFARGPAQKTAAKKKSKKTTVKKTVKKTAVKNITPVAEQMLVVPVSKLSKTPQSLYRRHASTPTSASSTAQSFRSAVDSQKQFYVDALNNHVKLLAHLRLAAKYIASPDKPHVRLIHSPLLPSSAYALFLARNKHSLPPNLPLPERAVHLATQWKSLPPGEKEKYAVAFDKATRVDKVTPGTTLADLVSRAEQLTTTSERRMSGYALFMRDYYKNNEKPVVKHQQIGAIIKPAVEAYRALSDTEKKQYAERAKQLYQQSPTAATSTPPTATQLFHSLLVTVPKAIKKLVVHVPEQAETVKRALRGFKKRQAPSHMSAYTKYFKQRYEELKSTEAIKGLGQQGKLAALSAIVGKEWRSLSPEAKQRYQ